MMANLRDVRRMGAAMTKTADAHDMPITVRQVGLLAQAAARGLSTPLPTEEQPLHGPRLTPRELQVLVLVANGLENGQIAHRLGLRSETIKSVLRRIYDRLGAKDRAHAASIALALGLMPPGAIEIPRPKPPAAPVASFSGSVS